MAARLSSFTRDAASLLLLAAVALPSGCGGSGVGRRSDAGVDMRTPDAAAEDPDPAGGDENGPDPGDTSGAPELPDAPAESAVPDAAEPAEASGESPVEDAAEASVDACVRQCEGRDCGSDGCGGSCGTCGPGLNCLSGLCTQTCGNGDCQPDAGETCGSCEEDCGACNYVDLYAKCGVDGRHCDPSKHVCTLMDSGVLHGYCLEACDLSNPACPGGTDCVALASSGGVCLPAGTGPVDSLCGDLAPDADTLDLSRLCDPSLMCVVFDPETTTGLCMQTVGSCASAACGEGRLCLGLTSGKGVCAIDCSKEACPAGTECIEIGSPDVRTCVPEKVAGSVGFGGICKDAPVEARCQKGLDCLEQYAATQGFCSLDCTQSGVCPEYANSGGQSIPSACLEVGTGLRMCMFPCGQPGQLCPDGLSCQGLGGGTTMCLAP